MKKLLFLIPLIIGFLDVHAESFSGSFAWNDYSEYTHSFSIAQDGDVTLTITTGPDLNLYGYVRVLDSDGSTIYSTYQGPGTTVDHAIRNLRVGSYTIAIKKDGRSFYYGNYSGYTTLTPNSVENDAENNETIDDANLLPLDTTETGHLGYRGQAISTDMIDWYVVTTDNYGDFSVQVTTSGDSIRDSDGDLNLYGGVYIVDSNKSTYLYSTHQGPGSDVTHVVRNLRPGTYYIGLEKDGRGFYWGSYTVKASLAQYTRSSDLEPNDTLETANVISAGQSVTGNLGARGQDQATDMNDYWVLNHSGGDLAFSVRTSGSEDEGDSSDGALNLNGGVSIISAENPDSSIYYTRQPPGTYQEHRRSDLAAGVYYIRLEKDGRGFYWGTYELHVQAESILSLSPTMRSHGSEAVSGQSISISANVSWTASAGSDSWITFVNATGSQDGTLTYALSANPTSAVRTGTITVSGGGLTQTFTVEQAGSDVTGALTQVLGLRAENAVTSGGNAEWIVDGGAARSGAVADDQQTWVAAVFEGPGTLTFEWKVSSEGGFDKLHLYVNDQLMDDLSGESGWQQSSVDLGPGQQTVTWEYRKDGSISTGSDAGWVRSVVFTEGATAGSWFSAAVDLGGGWRWFDWFGAFNVSNGPWIYHAEHGWLYPFADGPGDVYFWDTEMNSILWTSETVYPSLYRFSDAQWVFYQKGSSNPRWFVNLLTGQWEQW